MRFVMLTMALLGLLLMGAKGGCGGTAVTTCKYGGKTYNSGDSFSSTDGCNSCSCDAYGQVACTTRACAPACVHDGKSYKTGEEFPQGDGCNKCKCSADGTVACTNCACDPQAPKACGSAASTCKHDGKEYKPGDKFTNGGSCCTCEASGQATCTDGGPCEADTTCKVGDKTYKEGESFAAPDGCNTCTCAGGKSVCTQKACAALCGDAGVKCGADAFCALPEGSCKADDPKGACQRKPQGCDDSVDPVCGCDGKTYSNACEAQAVGMNIKKKGDCNAVVCKANGKEYQPGEQYSDGQSCCTCGKDGKSVCTDGGPCPTGCSVGDKTYKEGESFPASDGCNTCTCKGGNVTCTEKACTGSCTHDGKTYKEGESFPAPDLCNTCTCKGGKVTCTEKICSSCKYNGQIYKEGESFPASDGCNTCSCKGGLVGCTKIGCTKCGSPGAPACKTDQFCNQPGHCGLADRDGACQTKPTGCTRELKPVCGCDGKTYPNECNAHAAGVSVKFNGDCAGSCSYNGQVYKDGDSFKATDGCNECTCKSGSVTCTLRTCTGCTYKGQTYKHGETFKAGDGCNECTCSNGSVTCSLRSCAGCSYNGQTYKEGESFPASDGCNTCTCKGGLVGCTKIGCTSCGSRGLPACSTDKFCNQPGHCGASDKPGACLPKPGACTREVKPVCGCDDKTYSNECVAHAAGVSVKATGECTTTKSCTYNGQTYKDGDSFKSSDGCNTCTCSGGSVICTKRACAGCTYNGQTYNHGDTFKAGDGCNTCTCSAGTVSCTKIACNACGSRGLPACPTDKFCNQPTHCGATDIPGTCEPKPGACTRDYKPVCGCDGKTYSNECVAHSAGVSVKSTGTCP